MNELLDTGLKILAALAALLLGGGIVYWRGRSSGRRSVPHPSQVRAEEREQVHEEHRAERAAELHREVVRIRDETLGRIERGKASQADAERLLREAEEWPRD